VDMHQLLRHSAFEADDVQRTAYERASALLVLHKSTEPFKELVARYIIEVAKTGEKDPEAICARAFDLMLKGCG
jgi:hypothetical protein